MKRMRLIATIVIVTFSIAANAQQRSSVGGSSQRQAATTTTSLPYNGGSCAAPSSTASTYFMDAIYASASASAKGTAPFANANGFKTYHNVVKDFQAKSDASGDQTQAIQKAIDDGRKSGQPTTHPRTVFLPAGNYTLGSTLNLKMGTVVVGNPADPPTIQASKSFDGDTLVNGYDDSAGSQPNDFMTVLKNVILDTTALDPSKQFLALQWGISQACALGNVAINMPTDSSGHTGMRLDGGSTLTVADVKINGGAVGIGLGNQQVNFKSISFTNCNIGYQALGGFTVLLQSPTFDNVGTCADITKGDTTNLAIIDATATGSGALVKLNDQSSAGKSNQVYIENLSYDGEGPIASAGGNSVLEAADHIDIWYWGSTDASSQFVKGKTATLDAPEELKPDGKYAAVPAPDFAQFSAKSFVNVKGDSSHKVTGDGKTDDSKSINAILKAAAQDCKAVFFPAGVYLVKSTIQVPPNSQIIGEAWSTISGSGDTFNDASKPTPVVQVGEEGDSGIATIQDMRFTVADVLPGAIIMQWNIKGSEPGAAGLWNSIINIGGAADSQVTQNCAEQDPTNCQAAFLGLHLAKSSSVYVENVWIWTADHALDGTGGLQIIATHGGTLVEANPGPTWFVGVGSEHHWLYQFNIHNARNVFGGMLQMETPYNQGQGAAKTTPAPWKVNEEFGDPDYSWCDDDDQKCHTAMSVNINGGQDIFLYCTASWAFFNGEWNGKYDTFCQGTCQTNMNVISGEVSGLHWAHMNSKAADHLVHDGKKNPGQDTYKGGWGGLLVQYDAFAG